jgi:hypothetical protein
VGAGLLTATQRNAFIKQFFNGEPIVSAHLELDLMALVVMTALQLLQSGFLADQSGDFKLEFNTEYRAQIYGLVKGALFIDAVISGYSKKR